MKRREDPIEGMTGRCGVCGQDVGLRPLKLAPGSPPPRRPGPRLVLHVDRAKPKGWCPGSEKRPGDT